MTNNLWSMIKALALPLPTLNSPNRKVQRATVCKDRPRLLLQKSRKKFPINWEFLELGLSHVALRRATAEKPWTLVIARCLAGKVFHNLAKTLGAGSGQISSASQRFLQLFCADNTQCDLKSNWMFVFLWELSMHVPIWQWHATLILIEVPPYQCKSARSCQMPNWSLPFLTAGRNHTQSSVTVITIISWWLQPCHHCSLVLNLRLVRIPQKTFQSRDN